MTSYPLESKKAARYQPTRTELRRLIKYQLYKLQNGCCKICKEPRDLDGGIIEHHNNNNRDWRSENIGFVDWSCNQRKRPDFQTTGSLTSGQVEREDVSRSEPASLSALEADNGHAIDQLRAAKAPPEMIKNYESEPLIRRYLWENVGREGDLLLSDVIAEAAEYSGCDTQTAERKIRKAVSKAGPFDKVSTLSADDYKITVRKTYRPNNTKMGLIDRAMQQELERTQLAKGKQEVAAAMVTKDTNDKLLVAFTEKSRKVDELEKRNKELEAELRQSPTPGAGTP